MSDSTNAGGDGAIHARLAEIHATVPGLCAKHYSNKCDLSGDASGWCLWCTTRWLLAALSAAQQAHQWRDISTAPKDGTWVLLHQPDNGTCAAGWMTGDIEWWHVTDGKDDYPVRGAEPDGWLPLPPAPGEDGTRP